MEPFGLPTSPHVEKTIFTGNAVVAGTSWQTWVKPTGKSMLSIVIFGGGGGGGNGSVGNPPTQSGGGGGGSGGMTAIEIPFAFLPNRLYISVAGAKTGAGLGSYVSTQPNLTANHVLALAYGGGQGGNGSTSAGGSVGSAAGAATAANMPLGWPFRKFVLGGQAGTPGGLGVATVTSLILPLTGLRATGGTGGAGLGGDGNAGVNGGSFTIPAAPTVYPAHAGGAAQPDDDNPPENGTNGYRVDMGTGGYMYYGGTGGGSASYAGSLGPLTYIQTAGGNGAVGSGGGGSSAAPSGSTLAALSYGGPGLVILTCY